MKNYIVSARKYRPDTFETVVAQKSLTTTLKNAILSGKLAHAYLFCGPRGVGKTTCARIFAKTINCSHPTPNGEPCNECESCQSFNQQRSYTIYELDAASNNSVDDIRQLNDQVRIPPQTGRYKVYIIDEVHMLSLTAFNAFLKTLEEPPAHAIFILATTEKHKIIPTILSRCQIYDFGRIEAPDIMAHLQSIATKEGINSEYEALRIIAQKSDGCMRDALSLFDQMVSFTQGNLTYSKVIESLNVLDYDYYFRFTDLILASQTAKALLLFNEIIVKGFDGSIFIEGMASHFRDLLVSSDPVTYPLFEGSEELCRRYAEQAQRCTPKIVFRAIKLCSDCSMNYRASRNKRLLVELTIIQLSQLTQDDTDEDGGRSPKQLKPIFNKPENQVQQPQQQVQQPLQQVQQPLQQVQQVQQPLQQVQQPPQQVQQPLQQVQQPQRPQQQVVNTNIVQGRPESLRPKSPGNGTTLGGMFRTTMNTQRQGQDISKEKEPVNTSANAVLHTQQPEQPKSVSSEQFAQAWMAFAMRLPENERALADRMKILIPVSEGDGIFSIAVDNQLVAEMFERETKRILDGMSSDLGGVKVRLKINVNKVVVERHVYDRTKQFEILRTKNPAIDKLRNKLQLVLS